MSRRQISTPIAVEEIIHSLVCTNHKGIHRTLIIMSGKDIREFGSEDWVPPPINIVNFDSYRINNSHHEIVEEVAEYDEDGGFGGMPTINEEEYSTDLFSYERDVSQVVYVVTWKGTEELTSASMDALLWTLGDLRESSIVYLVHVFPELRFMPTPIGRLPISQANPEQKEGYVIQERTKRREYLQRFLSLCSSSKVEVETVLIESDLEAKAILDLIPILNIRKLVLGATKSTLRKLKKGSGGTLDQIVNKAPGYCEVKVICEGKEVSLQEPLSSEPASPMSSRDSSVSDLKTIEVQPVDQTYGLIRCSCFKL